jgi:hypothetical protein
VAGEDFLPAARPSVIAGSSFDVRAILAADTLLALKK